MRIALVVHTFFPNWRAGTEVYTLNVARKLQEYGHQIQLVCYEPNLGTSTELTTADDTYEGLSVHRIMFSHDRPDKLLREYFNVEVEKHLIKYYSRIRPDVVHVMHSLHLSAATITAAKHLGLPVVCTAMDFWYICPTYRLLRVDNSICPGPVDVGQCIRCYARPTIRCSDEMLTRSSLSRLRNSDPENFRRVVERPRRLREIFRLVDVLIAPNHSTSRVLSENGLTAKRSMILGFGLSLPPNMPVTKIPSEKLRLGYIGSFDRGKGPHVLLEAVRRLSEEGALELTLYGDKQYNPEYFSELQHIARSDERIRFAGTFPNEKIGEILSKIDFLVIPSLWYENTPLVLFSAFATKTPVLVSNVGSLADAVSQGRNGLVFKVGDPVDLARQIESILQDPSCIERLRQGIPAVKSMDQNVIELLEVYSTLSIHPSARKPTVWVRPLAKWLEEVRSEGFVTRLTAFEQARKWPVLTRRRACFGRDLELWRCQYAVDPGRQVSLRFVWRCRRPPKENFLVVVQLLDRDRSIFRAEHRLEEFIGRNGTQAEGLFEYVLPLQVPERLPSGFYDVRLGIWDESGAIPIKPTRVWGWREESSRGIRLNTINLQ